MLKLFFCIFAMYFMFSCGEDKTDSNENVSCCVNELNYQCPDNTDLGINPLEIEAACTSKCTLIEGDQSCSGGSL